MTNHLNKKAMLPLAMTLAAALVTGCTAVSAESHAMADASFNANKSAVMQSQNRKFVNINPMIKFSPAYGQFSETAHGTFGSFPARFETPVHIHSGAYHGVVIKGTMTNPFEGETNAPELSPGSYWYVPANMHHTTACVSNTPCGFYFHADKSFDFTPIE